jgi:hypothetical protein
VGLRCACNLNSEAIRRLTAITDQPSQTDQTDRLTLERENA